MLLSLMLLKGCSLCKISYFKLRAGVSRSFECCIADEWSVLQQLLTNFEQAQGSLSCGTNQIRLEVRRAQPLWL